MDAKTLLHEQRQLVEKLRKEAAEVQRRLEMAAAEERAMLRLWEVVSSEDAPPVQGSVEPMKTAHSGEKRRRSGGRPPGAITKNWQDVLRQLYGQASLPYSVIAHEVMRVTGSQIEPSSVRDRVRAMVRMGFMSGDAATGFTVTEAAAQRFGFRNNEGPTEAGPSNDAGPVGREGGYPPSTPEGSTPSGSTPDFLSTEDECDLA